MKIIKLIKNPRKFIQDKANLLAEKKIREQNFIPITETLENDIFIAGYPKSGNTWMQNLLSSILLESTSQRLTPRLVNEIVPDVHAKQYYKRFFPIMFFKTHDLPKPHYKKVIHLVRDGRDVMVSYYKMGVNQDKNFPYSLEDMVVDGKGVFPSEWYIHTRSWINNPYHSSILTVRYEDLLQNPLIELKRICKFSKISIDDSLLNEIINANEIDKLRDRFIKFGTENENIYKNKHVSSFYRKGSAGDYKNYMSNLMINKFNAKSKNELVYFGYTL